MLTASCLASMHSVVLCLLLLHLFFVLTQEAAVWKFLFGKETKRPQNDDGYSSSSAPISSARKLLNEHHFHLHKRSNLNDIEIDTDGWVVFDSNSNDPESQRYSMESVQIQQFRNLILSSLESDATVRECIATLKTKFNFMEARLVSIPAYLAFFEELLSLARTKPVPDSILKEVLNYIYERISKSSQSSSAPLAPVVIEITKIIFLHGHGKEVTSIALQLLKHFNSLDLDLCNFCYVSTLNLLEAFPEHKGKLLDNFYMVISECRIEVYTSKSQQGLEHVASHYDLAPIYRILLLKDSHEWHAKLLRELPWTFSLSLEHVQVFNAHLNSTDFLNTAQLDEKSISSRCQIFSELFHRFTPPLLMFERIYWLLENELFAILEGTFIFMNSILFGLTKENIHALWKYVLVGANANFKSAALLLAYLPSSHMSIAYLNHSIMSWIDDDVEYDAAVLVNFRTLILATESVSFKLVKEQSDALSFPIPEALVKHFATVEELNKSLRFFLTETVQILLSRQFGIPFCASSLHKLPEKKLSWNDVSTFSNSILEKTFGTKGIFKIPKITA